MDNHEAILFIYFAMLITMTASRICTDSDKEPACEISAGCVCRSPSCITKVNPCPDQETLTIIGPMFAEIPPYSFENYKSLRHLEITGGIINTVSSKAFWGLSNLQVLSLRDNIIRNVNNHSLAGLNSLRELDLSGNVIDNLDEGVFSSNKNIVLLNLQRNLLNSVLRSMFIGCKKLESLYLSSNSISEIEPGAFSDLQNLEYLFLDDNYIALITARTFTGLTSLQHLNINGNFIQVFLPGSLDPLEKLEIIDLSQNQIPVVFKDSFASLRNLRIIYLHDNSIEWIDDKTFKNLTSLQMLQLSRNRLVSWSFVDFPTPSSLKELFLSYNKISEIILPTYSSKPHFPQLQYLYLSKNVLNSFASFFLKDAPLLDHSDRTTPSRFDLRENPLDCDCDNMILNKSMVQMDLYCSENTTVKCSNNVSLTFLPNTGLDAKYCKVSGSPLPEVAWIDSNGEAVTGYYNISEGITWLSGDVINVDNYMCINIEEFNSRKDGDSGKDDGNSISKAGKQEIDPIDSSTLVLPSFTKILSIVIMLYVVK